MEERNETKASSYITRNCRLQVLSPGRSWFWNHSQFGHTVKQDQVWAQSFAYVYYTRQSAGLSQQTKRKYQWFIYLQFLFIPLSLIILQYECAKSIARWQVYLTAWYSCSRWTHEKNSDSTRDRVNRFHISVPGIPKTKIDLHLKTVSLPENLDQYLIRSESQFPDIVPGSNQIVTLLVGPEDSWTPRNALQEKYWTHS